MWCIFFKCCGLLINIIVLKYIVCLYETVFFSRYVTFKSNTYSQQIPFWLGLNIITSINCNGNETSLTECEDLSNYGGFCSHIEDVYLQCFSSKVSHIFEKFSLFIWIRLWQPAHKNKSLQLILNECIPSKHQLEDWFFDVSMSLLKINPSCHMKAYLNAMFHCIAMRKGT